MEDWQVPLWNAINRYVETCGGDPSSATVSGRRMDAVVEVNGVVRSALATPVAQASHGKALLSSVLNGNDVLTDRAWKRAAKRLVDS